MVSRATVWWVVGFFFGCAVPASAQGTGKLALLIPGLFGPNGLTVDSEALLPDGSTHSAHFNSAFQAEFNEFNVALAGQLAAVPVPSPASGFTYTFDSSLGVFQRTTESFGPILAERAETIGKRKLSFGVTYQHFGFDSIEGVELGAVPAVFTHDDAQLGGGRSDLVTTSNAIDASVEQTVLFVTYGIGNHADVSLALPLVTVDLAVASDATVQRIGTAGSPATHYFRASAGGLGESRRYASSGRASGIGDLVARLKANPLRNDSVALALGVDARLPTGDEQDLLGLGAPGLRPFAVLTFARGRAVPHLNLAYQWNGRSVLAGDVAAGRKADVPDQASYVVGIDVGATQRLTIAVDFLGTYVIRSPRLVRETFTAANGASFPQIGFATASYTMATGAVGVKLNPFGRLLVDLNVRFKLDDAGLRDAVTPLVGVEYAF
jgi:hypothetical protein